MKIKLKGVEDLDFDEPLVKALRSIKEAEKHFSQQNYGITVVIYPETKKPGIPKDSINLDGTHRKKSHRKKSHRKKSHRKKYVRKNKFNRHTKVMYKGNLIGGDTKRKIMTQFLLNEVRRTGELRSENIRYFIKTKFKGFYSNRYIETAQLVNIMERCIDLDPKIIYRGNGIWTYGKKK